MVAHSREHHGQANPQDRPRGVRASGESRTSRRGERAEAIQRRPTPSRGAREAPHHPDPESFPDRARVARRLALLVSPGGCVDASEAACTVVAVTADALPYPARSLARHTSALMKYLRQPYAGLASFDDTADGLIAARADLRRIGEINASMPLFEDLVAKVDNALTLVMPFDGHDEVVPHDAWAAYEAGEAAVVALERRAGVKHRWKPADASVPNTPRTDHVAAVIEITAADTSH